MSDTKKMVFGALLMIYALIFGWLETRHFGYNAWPESHFEQLCDVTMCIMVFIGVYLFTVGIKSVWGK